MELAPPTLDAFARMVRRPADVACVADAPTRALVKRVRHELRFRQAGFEFALEGLIYEMLTTVARRDTSGLPTPRNDVALESGFSDQAHMTRLFRRHLGVTPGEYRRHLVRRRGDPRARRTSVSSSVSSVSSAVQCRYAPQRTLKESLHWRCDRCACWRCSLPGAIVSLPSLLLTVPMRQTGSVHRVVAFARRATIALLAIGIPSVGRAQEPAAWGEPLNFATFSIAAIDPRTGESGVAVTTRVPCVGNGVPWVRVGVGAVATQANTRTEYGTGLLDLLASGLAPDAALKRMLAADSGAASRQIGVIALDGRSATHTGAATTPWAGGRSGKNYVTQGNLLVSGATIDAVALDFEASEGSPRHLADRLIDAIAAGHAAGGDARKGRSQSAAVVVADPRPGRSRRPDKVTANINVCEHPEPVGELRRIYDTISQTLGHRELQSFSGSDVWQLKVMLHALGVYRPAVTGSLARDSTANDYTAETVAAVDAFRAAEQLAGPTLGSPRGLVDAETVARLWTALGRAGKLEAVRRELMDVTAVRR